MVKQATAIEVRAARSNTTTHSQAFRCLPFLPSTSTARSVCNSVRQYRSRLVLGRVVCCGLRLQCLGKSDEVADAQAVAQDVPQASPIDIPELLKPLELRLDYSFVFAPGSGCSLKLHRTDC